MHFIIFEATSEERDRPFIGLDIAGDRDLVALSEGDTIWIITRLGGERGMPGLCGRLIASEVTPHSASEPHFDQAHADCAFRLHVDHARSERCTPFPCEMIATWDIWRLPFRGARPLTDQQGQTLDTEWKRYERDGRG